MNIKMSIIIPVYNSEKYLRDCLDSVLNQTINDIEVICVDDGSSEESVCILEKYCNKDDRLRIIHQKHSGAANARNTGVKNAKGQYLWFVDSDDVIKQNSVEVICEIMGKDNLDMITFNADVIAADDCVDKEKVDGFRKYYHRKGDYQEFSGEGKDLLAKLVKNNDYSISACTFCIKREFFIKENLYFENGILNEDRIQMMFCFLKSKRVACINETLYVYRIRNDSASKTLYRRKRLDSLVFMYGIMIEQILKYRNDTDIKDALCSIGKDLFYEIRKVDATLNHDALEEQAITSELDFLYMGLGIGPYKGRIADLDIYELGVKRKIIESNGVYLYGAGEWGCRCLDYLISKRLMKYIKGFIVSENKTNNSLHMDIPLWSVNEVLPQLKNDKSLIFLSADYKVQKEQLIVCQRYELKNLIKLDWFLKALIIHDELKRSELVL